MNVTKIWVRFSLLNLVLVSVWGIIMRYKIGFPFPHFEQKYLQHAHSHFAFYGWVSHTLMALMVAYIQQLNQGISTRKYQAYILVNLLCSYGMLGSFSIAGYHPVSIFFSTTSILISYAFTYSFVRDFRPVQIQSGVSLWFRAALVFNALSSLGTFALAYMMVTHHIHQKAYLSSVYFYLHFQYNGWFFFACMGLAVLLFRQFNATFKTDRRIFWMFALSCVPAYLLSALWLKVPVWVYVMVVLASVVQTLAWGLLLRQFIQQYRRMYKQVSPIIRISLIVVALALCIKFVLQLGSVIPSVSILAFGFRPIIIAYLHLVLLGIVSVFLLTYLSAHSYLSLKQPARTGLYLFLAGVYLNELVLGIQGVASFAYFRVPYVNETLFVISLLLFSSLLMLLAGQRQTKT